MGEDRVVTLRFKAGSVPDMELYEALAAERAGLGLSMPAYVKGILGRHFEGGGRGRTAGGADACMERIREIVRGELASHSSAITGMMEKLAEGLPDRTGKPERAEEQEGEESLPAYSGDFPERLYGVLEKFI